MSNKYRNVVLYYPNKWRERVNGFVPEEDLSFSWFICSKRYRDPKTGLDVANLSKSTKFYDEESGETLVLNSNNVTVLIGGTTVENVEKYGYQGYVSTLGCEKSCGENFICKEIRFYILANVLDHPIMETECEIIRFSKRNYISIQKLLPEFPSPDEIDSAIKEFSNKSVCRVLYEFISEYFVKKKYG
ncbi:MAG TPA: hypothetical protein PKD85_01385 [Saprospiraceae bacterium]|nr:hypothetical protein [Saprospiraceae bacterium]